MATALMSISALVLLLLALNCICSGGQGQRESFGGSQRRDACRRVLDQGLSPRDPEQFPYRSRSEGGYFEYATPREFNDLDCAGVAIIRETIEPNALSLPRYTNTPHLAYVTHGRGLFGLVIPGCPPNFRDPFSSEQEQQRGRSERGADQESPDTCQKIRRVQQGDVVSVFAGATFWWYNDASNEQLRLVAIADVSNNQNQLDRDYVTFLVTGQAPIRQTSRRRGEEEETREGGDSGDVAQGIFGTFSARFLARTLHTSNDTISRIQQQQQQQGQGLHVRLQDKREEGLDIPYPRRRGDESESEVRRGRESTSKEGKRMANGVAEETVCSMRMRHFLDNPNDAEVYVAGGGRMNTVNRQKLASLRFVKLAADRVSLRPGAMFAPSWVTNAHRVIYVTRGRGFVQIIGDNGNQVFSGEVREGQFLVIPQQCPAVKEASSNDNFEWVAFLTHDTPVREKLAGVTSLIDGLPREVLAAAFGVDEAQAEEFKRESYRRREYGPILSSVSSSASYGGRALPSFEA
uniref:Legumin; 11S globulin n=1 Tax=Welwitschia mirabilis TaxID=3377 RepID=Q41714_WELMI|nr:legumin; 11S globulin [Welwitschia mirabilis]